MELIIMTHTQLPSQWKATNPNEFIGPARKQAQWIERLVAQSKTASFAPIKLMILGKPGIGKTNLAEYMLQCVGASKWATTKWNGTEFRIEDAESLRRDIHFTTMYGDYRVIWIEEMDRMSHAAQVCLLTALDEMPRRNCFVGTSNCRVKDLEERFQTRFQVVELAPPTADEIEAFLASRWQLAKATAKQIATFACGNVRQALMDAQTAMV